MTLGLLAQLGSSAFSGISGEVVKPCLAVVHKPRPPDAGLFGGISAIDERAPGAKAAALIAGPVLELEQSAQLENPDHRVILAAAAATEYPLLEEFANSYEGITSGDDPRRLRFSWELPRIADPWLRHQSTVRSTLPFGGCEHLVWWGDGLLRRESGAYVRGTALWGRSGVAVSQTGNLATSLYAGWAWDTNCAVIIPKRADDLPALWEYCRSAEYSAAIRRIDQSLKVTNATLVQVPFDHARWRRVAEESGPLPSPYSDDPTQWLFEGRPEVSTAPLQVAVARLIGYRWPEQAESDDLDALSDADGIVCVPSVAGEAPAAERVQQVLAAAFGEGWSPGKVKELLDQAGSKKKSLDEWLRDEFFKQHCSLFGNRPFGWHIWDGQRDGFSALVNYHRLDRKTLARLTYTYLGQDWVERQRAEVREEVAGAEARLSAAVGLRRKLEAILEGEAPYEIYVRWKEKHEQPIGWEPDLNDGVRLNVRPFVEAGVLRAPFNIHWRKDRGKNPNGSERENDKHLTLAEKLDARKRAGGA